MSNANRPLESFWEIPTKKTDTSPLMSGYYLLQNVLFDAFNISASFFTPPYENIRKIDFGLRAAVWTDYDDSDNNILFLNTSKEYRILIIKSNLGFYNILVTLGLEEKPDFISIGPFRNDELSPHFFSQVMKEAHILNISH